MSDATSTAAARSSWRTPLVVLLCGGIILTLALGIRHTFGLYLQPMTQDLGWTRQTFSIALALQNLVYGLASPFAGMVADKYGAPRALIAGTLIYALGLALMALRADGLGFQPERRAAHRHRHVVHRFRHRLRRGGARLPARETHHRARHRELRGLVRAVSDAAVRATADQSDGLAGSAARLCGDDPRDTAAVGGADRGQAGAGRDHPAPVDTGSAARSVRPQRLRAAVLRLLRVRLPAHVHLGALSRRSSPTST